MSYIHRNSKDCCNPINRNSCACEFAVNVVGLCDPSTIQFSKSTDVSYKTDYNWTEISIPEILCIPHLKPDIEHIDKVLISAEITSAQLIETPRFLQIDSSTTPNVYATDANGFNIPLPNSEGTYLTGRKLLVEGILKQKIVYTADVDVQSVHSAHFEIPFSAFMIVYPKFTNAVGGRVPVEGAIVDLNEDFCIEACIEDVYIHAIDCRTMFKNVTLFLRARPLSSC